MALSWSGETAELKNLIDYSRRFRIGLIAVTAVRDSTLGQAADVTLVLPQAREACPHNLAPTTSSLMQLGLGDASRSRCWKAAASRRSISARCIRADGSGRC
jgi:arabinose-5-phosphate isomerase